MEHETPCMLESGDVRLVADLATPAARLEPGGTHR
jgi:hypothetical protein